MVSNVPEICVPERAEATGVIVTTTFVPVLVDIYAYEAASARFTEIVPLKVVADVLEVDPTKVTVA